MKYINYCIKSLTRKRADILKSFAVVFISFSFVCGVVILQQNMYEWQLQSAKHTFGSWFVMILGDNNKEKEELKNYPYLDKSGKATIVNTVYDEKGKTNLKLGYMSDSFIDIGNIKLDSGHMPQKDDEIAVDEETLIKLNQGSELGQNINLSIYSSDSKNEHKIEKTYKLTGILNSYTNAWVKGEIIPSIIVTKNEADNIKGENEAVYIYSLKKYIKGNYKEIFEGIKKQAGNFVIYNSSVYDYSPWDTITFNYMYIILMIIGITIISYQLVIHMKKRKDVYNIIRGLGAEKSQLNITIFIENTAIVIGAALMGLIVAFLGGRIIAAFIEHKTGVKFFLINSDIYGKLLLMVIAAIVIGSIVSIIGYYISGKKRVRKLRHKRNINKNNYIFYTHKRLMASNGIIYNFTIRIFAAAMLVVMIFCIINSLSVYGEYENRFLKADLVGYKKTDSKPEYFIDYIYDELKVERYNSKIIDRTYYENLYAARVNTVSRETYDDNINKNVLGEYLWEGEIRLKYNVKYADAMLYEGIDDNMINYIKSIKGVKDINYSCYENERIWTWDDMDFNKMGLAWFINIDQNKGISVDEKYLFATEYVAPDAKIYDILCKYTDKNNFSYEDFCNGTASVVFVDSNIEGKMDDTLKKDTQINLMNYKCMDTIYGYSDTAQFNDYYNNIYKFMIRKNIMYKSSVNNRYFIEDSYVQQKMKDYKYDFAYVPAATTRAAAVIPLTESIKESLKEYIPQFAQYTMISSTALGQAACDKQNELIKSLFDLRQLPEEITLGMKYNQIKLTYGLDSTYLRTVNTVASYLNNAGFSFNMYSQEKEQLKSETVEMLMMYGFILATAVIVYITVSIIILNNRLDKYQDRIRILKHNGADVNVLVKICMIESVRELIWCIILMPVLLLIHFIIIKYKCSKIW